MTTDVASIPVELFAIGGGSIAAIGAAAALLSRRRRQRPRIDTEDVALAGAAGALAGFSPHVAVIGQDGAAALVSGVDTAGENQLALVTAGEARLTARRIDWDAVRATAQGMLVETDDRRKGAVLVAGVDALDVRRLAPAPSPEAVRIAESLAPPPDISGVVSRPG